MLHYGKDLEVVFMYLEIIISLPRRSSFEEKKSQRQMLRRNEVIPASWVLVAAAQGRARSRRCAPPAGAPGTPIRRPPLPAASRLLAGSFLVGAAGRPYQRAPRYWLLRQDFTRAGKPGHLAIAGHQVREMHLALIGHQAAAPSYQKRSYVAALKTRA